jgi:hypothetical protein
MNHKVERRRASQAFALGHVKLAVIQTGLRLRDETPVNCRELIKRGNSNAKESPGRRCTEDGLAKLVEETGFDDGDGEASLGEANSNGVAASSSTYDDIIKTVLACQSFCVLK